MRISELVQDAHGRAVSKGWYERGPINVPEKLALIHSEISEALECYRKVQMALTFVGDADLAKPEGFGTELADVVIRVADLCGALGIDLQRLIEIKSAYNETRPYRHGGKTC